MKRTIKLTICYDGSNYFGFQRQARETTIQQILEEKLARICGEPVTVTGGFLFYGWNDSHREYAAGAEQHPSGGYPGAAGRKSAAWF